MFVGISYLVLYLHSLSKKSYKSGYDVMKLDIAQEKKFYLVSLGCARNLVDSEVMFGSLLKGGWTHTHRSEESNAVIINTCGFIESAKEESIDTILSFAEKKRENPDFKLIVTGCLSQRYKTQLSKGLPEVDFFLGTDQFTNILDFINKPPKKGAVITRRSNYLYNENVTRVNTLSKVSAYVKVAEGCQHNCAFCIIPAIRGKLRSRTITSVEKEVRNLVGAGVKEVILIAQDLAAFGRDKGQDELLPLLKSLVAIEELRWIRLLYLYPENISDEFLDFMSKEDKIVKYIDIPVQHASDSILKKMGRCLNKNELISVIKRVRHKVPGVAIRTTVMVGFPGESEEDFEELRQFVADNKFEHLGCFSYSPEEGTIAARMPEQVPESIKKDRYDIIMSLQQKISAVTLRDIIGKHFEAVFDSYNNESKTLLGRLSVQAPDVDGSVEVSLRDIGKLSFDPALLVGNIRKVCITRSLDYDLEAELIH